MDTRREAGQEELSGSVQVGADQFGDTGKEPTVNVQDTGNQRPGGNAELGDRPATPRLKRFSMITMFQQVFGKIIAMVGGIAISLGILTAPINTTPLPQQSPVITATESVPKATISGSQNSVPVVTTPKPSRIFIPTLTPTPTISPCEKQIKEILSSVEESYTALMKQKEERQLVERCNLNIRPTWAPTPSSEDVTKCDQWNQSVTVSGDDRIKAKMNEYKSGLTRCIGQEVKFSKYSSKISADY